VSDVIAGSIIASAALVGWAYVELHRGEKYGYVSAVLLVVAIFMIAAVLDWTP
jgi:hypothetical protein